MVLATPPEQREITCKKLLKLCPGDFDAAAATGTCSSRLFAVVMASYHMLAHGRRTNGKGQTKMKTLGPLDLKGLCPKAPPPPGGGPWGPKPPKRPENPLKRWGALAAHLFETLFARGPPSWFHPHGQAYEAIRNLLGADTEDVEGFNSLIRNLVW